MSDRTITVRYGNEELRRRLALLFAALMGRVRNELVEGVKLRVATVFFSKVKEAFIVKARGGTDEAGIRWARLNPKTLAYSRRGLIRKAAKKDVKAGRKKYRSQREYNLIYRREYARMALSLPLTEARRRAKNIALYHTEPAARDTKIGVARQLAPGADYEILRDTDVLFNSLQPGVMAGDTYTPRDHQVVRSSPQQIALGTNVAYAAAHHYGVPRKGVPARPLWPEASRIPQSWNDAFNDALQRGTEAALLQVLR